MEGSNEGRKERDAYESKRKERNGGRGRKRRLNKISD